jgi:acylglycerol lipase
MKHVDGTFKGARDTDIYYQCWLPDDEPKAVLMVAHGLAEHGGRYMNLVNHFVPLGYGVYAIDHIGHGKSGGARVFVENFSEFIDPLKTLFDKIQASQSDKPIFLVGHSMGGLIAACYLLEHQEGLKGALLSGPAVKVPRSASGMTVFIGKILSAIVPKAGLVQLVAEGISRDPAVVEAYRNDPLVFTGKITARLAAQLLASMERVSNEAATITLPLMLVQGSKDILVDPEGAQMLYDLVASKDKTIKIYEGFFHEVFNEPEHKQVLGDVQDWLEAHLTS